MSATLETKSSTNSYLGIGLYSIPEVARLIRTPGRTVYQWARGYTFAESADGNRTSVIEREYPELVQQSILTFLDLVELNVVRMLRVHGVPMKTIREAGRRLSEKCRTMHPFAVRGIETDARIVFHADETGIEQLGAYQFVFEEIARRFFVKVDYDDEIASRIWPIGDGKVVLDPKRQFGKPIVHRGSVPTRPLYQMRLSGESPERIARWYDIPVQSVLDAIEFEESLAA